MRDTTTFNLGINFCLDDSLDFLALQSLTIIDQPWRCSEEPPGKNFQTASNFQNKILYFLCTAVDSSDLQSEFGCRLLYFSTTASDRERHKLPSLPRSWRHGRFTVSKRWLFLVYRLAFGELAAFSARWCQEVGQFPTSNARIQYCFRCVRWIPKIKCTFRNIVHIISNIKHMELSKIVVRMWPAPYPRKYVSGNDDTPAQQTFYGSTLVHMLAPKIICE